jgi:phage host-nuclease inhibitor protein Gam
MKFYRYYLCSVELQGNDYKLGTEWRKRVEVYIFDMVAEYKGEITATIASYRAEIRAGNLTNRIASHCTAAFDC